MKTHVRFVTLLGLMFLFLGISTQVFAIGGQGSIAFSVGLPQGDFDKNVNSTGYGINGNFGVQLGQSPFYGGLEFGYLIYGSETRNVPFSTTIPDVTVDVTTSNNILQGHLLLRAQSPNGRIRPYADGLLGFNYLYTETKIDDEDNIGNQSIASSTNFDDFAFSYGGGGIMIVLSEPQIDTANSEKARKVGILLDLRMRYLFGSEAEYLKKGGVNRVDGKVVLDPIKSKTDIITVNVGVAFQF